MAYSVKILKDSISQHNFRLTTMEVTLPRIVLSEFNTHRVFSRNSASSRAIPVEKRIATVYANPFIPEAFGKNKKGMSAEENLTVEESQEALKIWNEALQDAIDSAQKLAKLGVHKQLANRLLEPFSWQTIIVSATEWENFFALRCHPNAQPEIQKAAYMMRNAIHNSTPALIKESEWHLPLVDDISLLETQFSIEDIKKISIGRCARVSYLTHDGKRDPKADIELCEKLIKNGHFSPTEHVATPAPELVLNTGNFIGWYQYRKTIVGEAVFEGK